MPSKRKEKGKASFENADDLRKYLLSKAKPFIDDYLDFALGNKKLTGSGIAREAVWNVLSKIIVQGDDKTKLSIHGKNNEEQISDVLKKVSEGNLSPNLGKQYIDLIQAGFQITELNDLMDKLQQLENNGRK